MGWCTHTMHQHFQVSISTSFCPFISIYRITTKYFKSSLVQSLVLKQSFFELFSIWPNATHPFSEIQSLFQTPSLSALVSSSGVPLIYEELFSFTKELPDPMVRVITFLHAEQTCWVKFE